MSETRFTEFHDWVRMEADGSATVGITSYAQEHLGDLVYVDLPEVGRELAQGDEAATVESVKAASDVRMPLAGTVIAINTALGGDPGKVNTDPMGEGWFFKVRPAQPEQHAALMDQAAYDKLVAGL